MKILLTGASGFIGSALSRFLTSQGHTVVPLQRVSAGGASVLASRPADKPRWDPAKNELNFGTERQFDAVIHLAGENIAQRWSPKVKDRIYQSRVHGTRVFSEHLTSLPNPPQTLLCASGTGFYGDRGDELLDEDSSPGQGFLAKVSQDWECAVAVASNAGIRVVNLRFGLVLDSKGGALARMLPAFRFGLGGRLGSGRQYWSWIALADVQSAVAQCLRDPTIRGPVNFVSPQPVTNAEFTKTLASVLHRPSIFPVPVFALKALFGEMAQEAMLISFRVIPKRLQESGFSFQFPELRPALESMLTR